MRVALLCPYALDVPGGVQGQVMGLAREFLEMSIDVCIMAPARGVGKGGTKYVAREQFGKLSTDLNDRNMLRPGIIEIVGRSIPLKANGSIAPVDISPGSWVKGLRSIDRRGYDIVHIHEPFAPGIGYACMLACKLPMVGTFHRAGAGLPYRVLAPIARYGASRIDSLCAVSYEAAQTACVALGKGYLPNGKSTEDGRADRTIKILWNGIDIRRFTGAHSAPYRNDMPDVAIRSSGSAAGSAGVTAGSAGSPAGSSSAISPTSPVIVFAGRHEKRKGLHILLEAFKDISNLPSRPVLWVIGEGPETIGLRSTYGDDSGVVWLGAVDDEELAYRIAVADILCAPSLGGESFGMVPLEAMAASTLIVASDIPGYRAVIGDYGILVPPGNARLLSEGLALALDAVQNGKPPASLEDLSRARRHASEYSMHALALSYVDIYENVASRSRR
ncbi:MAG: glycosyltransferase family 4 protein [Actinobacteria bacterium]|nr:glycosyltransferase family 4 protein [Actinomycetota bacterium]